jgi:hypothetical protein
MENFINETEYFILTLIIECLFIINFNDVNIIKILCDKNINNDKNSDFIIETIVSWYLNNKNKISLNELILSLYNEIKTCSLKSKNILLKLLLNSYYYQKDILYNDFLKLANERNYNINNLLTLKMNNNNEIITKLKIPYESRVKIILIIAKKLIEKNNY